VNSRRVLWDFECASAVACRNWYIEEAIYRVGVRGGSLYTLVLYVSNFHPTPHSFLNVRSSNTADRTARLNSPLAVCRATFVATHQTLLVQLLGTFLEIWNGP
jgi:hypothetical protein